jgi:hypothetical protein
MAALQGRRNNLQHQDSSSDAAPLPDACFAPVSREGLHFLVGEPGESCIETCERAGYGTMDSGYGAFSGGDGMDGLVLCRVEVDGATRFFGERRDEAWPRPVGSRAEEQLLPCRLAERNRRALRIRGCLWRSHSRPYARLPCLPGGGAVLRLPGAASGGAQLGAGAGLPQRIRARR